MRSTSPRIACLPPHSPVRERGAAFRLLISNTSRRRVFVSACFRNQIAVTSPERISFSFSLFPPPPPPHLNSRGISRGLRVASAARTATLSSLRIANSHEVRLLTLNVCTLATEILESCARYRSLQNRPVLYGRLTSPSTNLFNVAVCARSVRVVDQRSARDRKIRVTPRSADESAELHGSSRPATAVAMATRLF